MAKADKSGSCAPKDSGEMSGLVYENLVSTVVGMARMHHRVAERAACVVEGANQDGGSAPAQAKPRPRVGNLAFDLAEMGLYAWRDLLTVQRRYEPEILHGLLGPLAGHLDPTAELHAVEPVLRFKRDGDTAKHDLQVENRSVATVELLLPRTLTLRRADELDTAIVELTSVPAAPVLGPGDALKLALTLVVPNERFREGHEVRRFLGELEIRTRGRLCVTVPVELTV